MGGWCGERGELRSFFIPKGEGSTERVEKGGREFVDN
jgi:hypothetical protein